MDPDHLASKEICAVFMQDDILLKKFSTYYVKYGSLVLNDLYEQADLLLCCSHI